MEDSLKILCTGSLITGCCGFCGLRKYCGFIALLDISLSVFCHLQKSIKGKASEKFKTFIDNLKEYIENNDYFHTRPYFDISA